MRITHLSGKALVSMTTRILLFGIFTLIILLSLPRFTYVILAASNAVTPFTISSADFQDGGPLSAKNAYNRGKCIGTGLNVAPALNWQNEPSGTKSFVLLMLDYDASRVTGFRHWITYNIPADVHQLQGKNAFTGGKNDFGDIGYDGPCPPPTGQTHHYLFLLYATKIANIGAQGLEYKDVISAIQNSLLGATSIIGTFHLPQ